MYLRLFHNTLRVVCLASLTVALVFAARFALQAANAATISDSGRIPAFAGSVKGRVFVSSDGEALFFTDHGRLRFNLENFSSETGVVTIFENGREARSNLLIPPGLTKVELPVSDSGGPALLRFRWQYAGALDSVILTQRESTDYRRARRGIYLAGTAAALLLLLAVFVARNPNASNTTIREREVGFAVFIACFALFFWIHDHALIPLTGDEPHYMTLAESLFVDGDYDVLNNYAGLLRQTYYPGELLPHTVQTQHGVLTARYPGVAVLLAPAYLGPALGLQIQPYTVSKAVMIVCSALAAVVFFQSLLRFASIGFSLCTVLLVFAGMPLLSYSNQIYPEVPGALLLLAILTRIAGPEIRSPVTGYFTAVLIVLLTFLNLKFNAAAFFCGVALLWKLRGQRRAFIGAGGVLAVGALAACAFAWLLYGDVLKGPYKDHSIVVHDFWRRYLTYLIDADRGLFALNPLLVFAFPGFALLFRKDAVLAACIGLLILLTNLSGVFQREETHWLLGYCPAGRYWVSVLPVIGWLAAAGWLHAWRAAGRRLRVLLGALALVGGVITLGQSLAFVDFQEAYYLPLKEAYVAGRYLAGLTGIDFTILFASYPFAGWFAAAVWSVALFTVGGGLALSVLRGESARNDSGDRAVY